MKHRWQVLTLSIGLMLSLAIGVASMYRNHIPWYFSPIRAQASRTLVTPMPTTKPTADAHRFDVGSIAFSVPTTFCTDTRLRVSEDWVGTVELDGTSTRLFIHLPRDNRDIAQAYRDTYSAELRSTHQSIASLRAAAYAASGEDFRWSMTNSELSQHQELIHQKRAIALTGASRVETWTNAHDVEGLIQILHESAWIEWYSRDDQVWGQLVFMAKEGERLDLDSLRAVCTSLEFAGDVYTFPPPDAVLKQITADDELN